MSSADTFQQPVAVSWHHMLSHDLLHQDQTMLHRTAVARGTAADAEMNVKCWLVS
jgi:hypothetical protein